MNGIFLWGTGHHEMAEKIDFSRLSDLPSPWPDELRRRSPWQETVLAAEGPESTCQVSEKRADAPVIFIAGACSSAMTLAWHFSAMDCLPEWGSVVCIHQWQGKGQLGRDWISPPGNLYAALRLPKAPPDYAGMMSLVTGYAVVRVLQKLGIPGKLKWPNDILWEGKKMGGILIQNRSDVSVAGVGLNLTSAPPPASLRAAHAIAATSLDKMGHAALPLSLWEQVVDRGRVIMDEMLALSPVSAIERIQAQMAFMGQEVRVDDHTGNAAYHATLMGLSQDGSLELRTGDKIETIRSGSIVPLTDQRKEQT